MYLSCVLLAPFLPVQWQTHLCNTYWQDALLCLFGNRRPHPHMGKDNMHTLRGAAEGLYKARQLFICKVDHPKLDLQIQNTVQYNNIRLNI